MGHAGFTFQGTGDCQTQETLADEGGSAEGRAQPGRRHEGTQRSGGGGQLVAGFVLRRRRLRRCPDRRDCR